jgi:NAD(P)-dependent dehydrogenase (short-subunit alcohol dehydrogenase family)
MAAGIGRATAFAFAAEGAKVIITGRDAAQGAATVEAIAAQGGHARFLPCDVRDPADCEKTVHDALFTFGQVDILFNNAGIVPVGTILETSLETWQDVFATNVHGLFYMSRAVLPHMIEHGKGVIVNNCSDFGVVGGQRAMAYCATKGAVAQITRAMALDHGRQGIRVNAICPGDTYVERWDRKLSPGQQMDTFVSEIGQRFPLGRVAEVEEIAKAVVFLACDDSSYMTGQMLVVDGGNTAGGTSTTY